MTPQIAAFLGYYQPEQTNMSTTDYLAYREGAMSQAISSANSIAEKADIATSPDEAVKYNKISPYNTGFDSSTSVQKPAVKSTQKPMNSDLGKSGTTGDGKRVYTSDEMKMFEKSANYAIDAMSDFSNAALSWNNAQMKSEKYEFTAKQNERAADLLYKNIADINRTARMDASIYKIQGKETKTAQKIAQAASGFAVGKGAYKVTLDTTDARTNYNIAMNMLKADLQVAEVKRKIGEYKAAAEIARGNANVARIEGRAKLRSNIIGGIGNLLNAGVSFYSGQWGIQKAAAADAGTK